MATQISAQKSSPSSPLAPLPPMVPGLPVSGSALSMARNPLRFFLTQYHRYGPIFRVRVLNHECTILGGLEVNQFLVNGDEVFPSKDAFAALAREYGTTNLLPAMDGPAHLHRRRLQRSSYSRERLYARMPEILHLTEEMLQGWKPGDEMAVFPTLQRIIVGQLGLVLLNRPPQDAFDAVRTLVQFNLFVNILGFIPPFPLRWPTYLRAKAQVIKLCAEIIEEHRALPPAQRIPDLVDDLLAERDEDGNPFLDSDIIGEMMGSFFAGMDTVSGTCSFMLYAILKTSGLLAQVQEEIDRAFSGGSFDLRCLKTMPALHATALETLRRYPIAPVTPRTVGQPFEFAGCRVESGARVLLVNGLTHFLPEYFPEPERFNIHHFDSDARKSRPANAFAPFALGAHTCLGAGLAETQIMVLISILLHTFELALDPPDFDAQMLLAGLPEARKRCSELAGIDYFKTVIAIHSDQRWMPAQEKNWSVVNVRYDRKHASSTVWHPTKSKRPIFRSWVTYDEDLPSSLYALTTYEHAKVNPQYYQAQKHLQTLQGRDNLWLAGLYMHDIDCHESAIVSAVKVTQQLAPGSTNLSKLHL